MKCDKCKGKGTIKVKAKKRAYEFDETCQPCQGTGKKK